MNERENAKLKVLLDELLRKERLLILSGRHRPEHPQYNNYEGLEEMAEELDADFSVDD